MWPRGRAHREGGLGHLAAVVRDAPTQAARDATAVVLLLAAHHRLHGVAAHSDGSLWPRGTGDSGSPPPGDLLQPKAAPAPGPAGMQPASCFAPQHQHRPQRCHVPAAAALAAAGAARAPRWGSSCSHGVPGLRAAAGPGQAPKPWLLPCVCTTFQNAPRNSSCSPAVQLHLGAHPGTSPWIWSGKVCKEPPALPAACTANRSIYQPLNITALEASHPHQHKCFWSSPCLCLINTSCPKCFCCSFGPLVSAVAMEES